jgi:hypothetical protein
VSVNVVWAKVSFDAKVVFDAPLATAVDYMRANPLIAAGIGQAERAATRLRCASIASS